jgi:hypothetical protein
LHVHLQAIYVIVIFQNTFENYIQTNNFSKSNSILTEEQFRFRKGLSTDEDLNKFLDEISCALSEKLHVGRISCDLAIVFDCVNHDTSLSKLILMELNAKPDTILSHIFMTENKE